MDFSETELPLRNLLSIFDSDKSNLHNLRIHHHFQGDTGAQGETQHGDSAAEDLRVLLEEFVGCLQEEKNS